MAISAGFSSLFAQSSVALLSNNGNPIAAVKSLANEGTIKSLAVAMITAGLIDKACAALNLAKVENIKLLEDHLKLNIAKASVGASINMAVNDADPVEAIAGALVQATINTVTSTMLAQEVITKVEHTVLQTAIGAVQGVIGQEGALFGALSGLVGALLPDMIKDKRLAADSTNEQSAHSSSSTIPLTSKPIEPQATIEADDVLPFANAASVHFNIGDSQQVEPGHMASNNTAPSLISAPSEDVPNNFVMQRSDAYVPPPLIPEPITTIVAPRKAPGILERLAGATLDFFIAPAGAAEFEEPLPNKAKSSITFAPNSETALVARRKMERKYSHVVNPDVREELFRLEAIKAERLELQTKYQRIYDQKREELVDRGVLPSRHESMMRLETKNLKVVNQSLARIERDIYDTIRTNGYMPNATTKAWIGLGRFGQTLNELADNAVYYGGERLNIYPSGTYDRHRAVMNREEAFYRGTYVGRSTVANFSEQGTELVLGLAALEVGLGAGLLFGATAASQAATSASYLGATRVVNAASDMSSALHWSYRASSAAYTAGNRLPRAAYSSVETAPVVETWGSRDMRADFKLEEEYAWGNSISVTKTLKSLGFSAEQKNLLSKGQQVIVESSKNNNHIAAIYKIEGDRLTAGIYSAFTTDTTGALAKFSSDAKSLGIALGVKEVELFGANIINKRLESILVKRGFQPGPDISFEYYSNSVTADTLRKIINLNNNPKLKL